MTPLADTVGFVDNEQADGAGEQVLEKRAVFETFWSQVKDLAHSFSDKSMRLAGLRCRQMGVHRYRADALRRELVVLVLHQGDQWAHYNGESGEKERRQLINHRLAAAGRHDYQCIFAGKHRIQRFPLSRPEIGVAKAFLEQLSG